MDDLLARALGADASQLMAEQRQALLSRLLSRLAHEVRNPLSSLDVHVQLLEEDLATLPAGALPKARERLAIIRSELHRLDNVVQQFLSLAGPSSIQLRPIDVAEIVEHVRQLFAPEAGTREIRLTAVVGAPLPTIEADAAQLTQALVNLVINALQAVERDGRVEIRAHADGPNVAIEVADSGPGIEPSQRAAIFEPFVTTKAEGTGLGLWIVHQIAVAHAGTVVAENGAGGGAVFTMRLPVRPTGTLS